MSYTYDNYILYTSGGIKYRLMEGYPKVTAERNDLKLTERYLIHTTDLLAFIKETFPPVTVDANGRLRRPNSRTYPGDATLFTKSLSAEPHTGELPSDPWRIHTGAPDNTFDFDTVVTIEYGTDVTDDQSDETLFEHSINVGGEFFTLPPQKLETSDIDAIEIELPTQGTPDYTPNKDLKLPISKVIPTIEHSFRYRFVKDPNWALYQEMLGCVNQNKHYNPDWDLPDGYKPLVGIPTAYRETVMFMGVSGTQRVVWEDNAVVTKPWDLDFKFSQKHHTGPPPFWRVAAFGDDAEPSIYGWNHVYIPARQKWCYLRTQEGNPIHRLADLNLIFNSLSTTEPANENS